MHQMTSFPLFGIWECRNEFWSQWLVWSGIGKSAFFVCRTIRRGDQLYPCGCPCTWVVPLEFFGNPAPGGVRSVAAMQDPTKIITSYREVIDGVLLEGFTWTLEILIDEL